MKCVEFELEWQEMDDPSLLSPEMDQHLRNCGGCAKLVRELNLLRWEAKELMEAEAPPARVWSNIRSELSREGLLREPGAQSWLNGILSFAWLPRIPMSVAYASVFFLALVGVEYVRDQVTPPTVAVSSAPAAPAAMALNSDSAAKEEAATASREGVASAELAAMPADEVKVVQGIIEKAPPERRAVLVRNLQQLDSSVGELQRFVDQHPDDPLAIEQLFIEQQRRARFLGTVVRMEEF